jgi:RNA polymerase sigma factor (TIGR02999 family)
MASPGRGDVTRLLQLWSGGDSKALDELVPLVYRELRGLAAAYIRRERKDHTLQPTALVHEAYVRLMDSETSQRWDSRGHFFAAAAEAMRRILINRARDKNRQKRAGSLRRVDLDAIEIALDTPAEDLLALDEALEKLIAHDKVCADLVQLRFFAGLTLGEAAEALGMPRRTADRHWAYARAWLLDRLKGQQ